MCASHSPYNNCCTFFIRIIGIIYTFFIRIIGIVYILSFNIQIRTPISPGASSQTVTDLSDLTGTELKVYNAIIEGRAITRAEIAEVTGLSDTAVERSIAKLIEKGLIKRIGSDKAGRWVKAL
jgi:ATP-dependent DNA helicase RecG